MIALDTTYDPKKYEKKWWKFWEDKKIFHAEPDEVVKPFTILMPPPNVTSQLHMGHGTCYTFQDMLIRWKRMCGFNACWLPGTDHAGIATQMMLEKALMSEEGKTKHDLGREEFTSRLWDWREKYGGLIYKQFEDIGFSADWQRATFTMDPHLSSAVRHVFVKLFEEGLIYRGERLVNWDPVLQTAISDDEVENKEVNGQLWYFKYPVVGSDEFISFATTRPETMLGDTAVAVNPDDERYQRFIGKKVQLPFTDRIVPIIADDYVKSEFGTGVVKITPAHDPNDFDIGRRHGLPLLEIFNGDGSLNDKVPKEFQGIDRYEARKVVIKKMKERHLFDKQENHRHVVPHSERSKAVIEPKLSLQWYVRMEELAKPAADAARDGKLRFFPDSKKKTYLHWLDNIQDWCISRQLWWGHRIPIWYCRKCDGISTGVEDPSSCSKCGSAEIFQDQDVLDTWFSSQLWPLSPFGWPGTDEKSVKDLDYFYPSNVLVTADEIIFLWVARMVMMGLKFRGEVPFRDIYFSAVVCDKNGRKFSKTLGNGIDPLEVIDRHGADAVRFTAVSLAPLGSRICMDVEDFDHGARFVNKLWNASRFLLNYLDKDSELKPLNELELDLPSQWLVMALRNTSEKVGRHFENYRLNEAVDSVYHFVWGDYCDWALESAKLSLLGNDEDKRAATLSVLVFALEGGLRLCHPLMPFITEEIWQKLPAHPDWERTESICTAAYPEAKHIPCYEQGAASWEAVQALIVAIRSTRQTVGISPKQKLPAMVKTSEDLVSIFEGSEGWIKQLAKVSGLAVSTELSKPDESLLALGRGFECYLQASGLVDFEKERNRLRTEVLRVEKIVSGLERKLANKNFVDRAPADVIAQTKGQLENMREQHRGLEQSLASLQ